MVIEKKSIREDKKAQKESEPKTPKEENESDTYSDIEGILEETLKEDTYTKEPLKRKRDNDESIERDNKFRKENERTYERIDERNYEPRTTGYRPNGNRNHEPRRQYEKPRYQTDNRNNADDTIRAIRAATAVLTTIMDQLPELQAADRGTKQSRVYGTLRTTVKLLFKITNEESSTL